MTPAAFIGGGGNRVNNHDAILAHQPGILFTAR